GQHSTRTMAVAPMNGATGKGRDAAAATGLECLPGLPRAGPGARSVLGARGNRAAPVTPRARHGRACVPDRALLSNRDGPPWAPIRRLPERGGSVEAADRRARTAPKRSARLRIDRISRRRLP